MNRRSGFDWLALIEGILLVALGVYTFLRPGSLLTGIVALYGLFALLVGIGDIVMYVRLAKYTGFGPMVSLVTGILSVMCGFMLLANPSAGRWAMTMLFPIWLLAHCISRLSRMNAVQLFESSFCYYFTLFSNILGLILGVLMLFRPFLSFLTMEALGYVAAIYLVLAGIESVVNAFGRRTPKW